MEILYKSLKDEIKGTFNFIPFKKITKKYPII